MFFFQTSVLWDIKAEVAQRAHNQAAGAGARSVWATRKWTAVQDLTESESFASLSCILCPDAWRTLTESTQWLGPNSSLEY